MSLPLAVRLTFPRIVESALKSKGYPVFDDPYDLNVIVVRTKDAHANTFNDFEVILFTGDDGKRYSRVFKCTSDPGLFWRKNPMNVRGTAILKEGRYPGMWKIGLHRGKPALRQVGPCTVWRDNNKDATLDTGPGVPTQTGIFLINNHRAGVFSRIVGRWSAGCVVLARTRDLLKILWYVACQKRHGHGNTVSVVVLNERDIPFS